MQGGQLGSHHQRKAQKHALHSKLPAYGSDILL